MANILIQLYVQVNAAGSVRICHRRFFERSYDVIKGSLLRLMAGHIVYFHVNVFMLWIRAHRVSCIRVCGARQAKINDSVAIDVNSIRFPNVW